MKWILLLLAFIYLLYSFIVSVKNMPDAAVPVNNQPTVVAVPVTIQDKWKADTGMYFYQSLSLYNYPHAAKYVTEPEMILAMEEGKGQITVKEDSYRVKEIRDDSIVMSFSRYCYPDLDRVVFLDHTPIGYRIDFRRSLKHQLANVPANYVPLRPYCYDFKDQPLQGTTVGVPWQATRAETNLVSFSSGPKKQIALVTEQCKQFPECTYNSGSNRSGFILYVDALDFTGSGGNLGGTEYVRLFNYSNYNQALYEGSYRVTSLGAGRVRLELSIPEFESTEINGYIDIEL